jgi:hypothetical protein
MPISDFSLLWIGGLASLGGRKVRLKDDRSGCGDIVQLLIDRLVAQKPPAREVKTVEIFAAEGKTPALRSIALRVVFQDAGNAGDNVLSGQAWILVGRERQIELVVQHGI